MSMVTRREFLKFTGAAAGTAALTSAAAVASTGHSNLDPARFGVLTDVTTCIGCRSCEWACAEEHKLPHGALDTYNDGEVLQTKRRPNAEAYTVVNRYLEPARGDEPLDVKVQCMHCEHPACVSACIVGALQKNPLGPVTYDAWKCIGCRYCMVACPYQIPAYEYENALTPRVMKCTMCSERTLEQGRPPACVEICPVEALLFGSREELLKIAHERIDQNPGRYHPEVHGEHAVGGTSWLLLGDRPATEFGIPKLANESPAVLTETIQHGIFRGFSGPLMLFTLLTVLMKSSTDKRHGKGWSEQDEEDNRNQDGEDHHA
ncbi:MAG: 4Fe-4S dicluster domain-containing protein [bacterium]|nr:4Fe-4S dicluster domain-containing protein [bacterium]